MPGAIMLRPHSPPQKRNQPTLGASCTSMPYFIIMNTASSAAVLTKRAIQQAFVRPSRALSRNRSGKVPMMRPMNRLVTTVASLAASFAIIPASSTNPARNPRTMGKTMCLYFCSPVLGWDSISIRG